MRLFELIVSLRKSLDVVYLKEDRETFLECLLESLKSKYIVDSIGYIDEAIESNRAYIRILYNMMRDELKENSGSSTEKIKRYYIKQIREYSAITRILQELKKEVNRTFTL